MVNHNNYVGGQNVTRVIMVTIFLSYENINIVYIWN